MPSGDDGILYFELQGSAGSLTEGGLQYNSDTSIQPYLRSTSVKSNYGYITLNNASAHYEADQILGLFHGVTPNVDPNSSSGQYLSYMIAGQLDPAQNPENDWISSTAVELDSAAWLFFDAPTDVKGSGLDPAGEPTICTECSISNVTAIAQSGVSTYSIDGSYFGVDSDFDNSIQWIQVAFGQWTSGCTKTSEVCPFISSADPNVYNGGLESYPTVDISQDSVGPTGYGPYETYAGIDLEDLGDESARRALGTFAEPFPPLPCTADSAGNCSLLQESTSTGSCNTGGKTVHGAPIYVYAYRKVYSIYRKGSPADLLENAIETQHVPTAEPCTLTTSWSPSDPKTQYNDPNLP